MSEWLRLGDLPGQPELAMEPDIVLGVVLSPYDVPDAVRGLRTDERRFRIEFRYIDGEEQGKQVKVGPHVTATEGKYSGRLLAMEVDVEAIGANSVGVSIATGVAEDRVKSTLDSAWDEVTKGFGRLLPERRAIAATRRAVATRENELLVQLAAH